MESLYEEVKSDGNICVHTKAEGITIFNQLYYKISLARILNLLKSKIKIYALFSNFVTKIFWLKAKILNISNTAVIEKIKRFVYFISDEMIIGSEVVIGEIKRIVHFGFKEVNIKNIISDLKMLVFYNFSKNYNIDITPSFEIENILLKRKVNTSIIKEGVNTNLETIEKKINTSALASSETIKSIEVVELEVRNNTPEEP